MKPTSEQPDEWDVALVGCDVLDCADKLMRWNARGRDDIYRSEVVRVAKRMVGELESRLGIKCAAVLRAELEANDDKG